MVFILMSFLTHLVYILFRGFGVLEGSIQVKRNAYVFITPGVIVHK